MKTKFIVVGVQRTGTTLIRTTLDDHSQIRCAGESFKAKRWRIKPYMGDLSFQAYIEDKGYGSLAARLRRAAITREFLDYLYAQDGDGAIGFKFMADQSRRYPAVVPYVMENGVKVIHVSRENVLKTWVSILTAKARGGFHSDNKGDVAAVNIKVPLSTLLPKLKEIQASSERWAEIFGGHDNYIHVTYEKFVAERERELGKLCQFLDVPEERAESDLKKLNSDHLPDLIDNYDQVCATLKGTPFEWCTK